METAITVVVTIVMIIAGMFLSHLLNAQHGERIAAFHYSGVLPGRGGRSAQRRQPTGGLTGPPVTDIHREHRYGGRGQHRPVRDRGGDGRDTNAPRLPTPTPAPTRRPPLKPAEPLPSAGRAEVRIVAASPEVARRVAEILRRSFASTEQRSYPAGGGGGTRLHLTVDTEHPTLPARSWLASGRSSGDDRPQVDEV